MILIKTFRYQIELNESTQSGWFENIETGQSGGCLWFNGKTLSDYDGVYDLPSEVRNALIANGYDVGDM